MLHKNISGYTGYESRNERNDPMFNNSTEKIGSIGYSNMTYNSMYNKPLVVHQNLKKEQAPHLKNFYYTRMMSSKLLEEAKNESQFINTRISNINEKNRAEASRERPKITANYPNISHDQFGTTSNNYNSVNETVDNTIDKKNYLTQSQYRNVSKFLSNDSDRYKKTSENVLYNLLDSQFSVNSPSKKMIYQHELDKLKIYEDIRNRLQTANSIEGNENIENNNLNTGNLKLI